MTEVSELWGDRLRRADAEFAQSIHREPDARFLASVGLPEPEELDLELHYDHRDPLLAEGVVGLYRVAGDPDVVWALSNQDGSVVELDVRTGRRRVVNSSLERLLAFLTARAQLSRLELDDDELTSAVHQLLASDSAIRGAGDTFWEDYYEVLLAEVGRVGWKSFT